MIYKLNNVDISTFGAFPVLSGERIAISGIFDCPKRKSPTERSWDTSVEPFVDEQDIKFEGRELSVVFILPISGNLSAFKSALIQTTTLTVDTANFSVICRSGIDVVELGNYYKIDVRFWQETVIFSTLNLTPASTGKIRINNFNLQTQFGVFGAKTNGFYSVGPRLEVSTTDLYSETQYRDYRELSIECLIVGNSFQDLRTKMSGFQALITSPGMHTLLIDNRSYLFYHKAGFKAQMITDKVLKFTLKLSTND